MISSSTPACSPLTVQEIFRSLLASNVAANTPRPSTTNFLSTPPKRGLIRYINNDQNNHREKYDGSRWRAVCTWEEPSCVNVAYTRGFCCKHNYQSRNKEPPKRKRKLLGHTTSLPNPAQRPHSLKKATHTNNNIAQDDDDDDDIQIIEEYPPKPATARHSAYPTMKTEMQDFNIFSVEHVPDENLSHPMKSEPICTSSSHNVVLPSSNDIEYVTSRTRAPAVNYDELIARNIPPLTEFEEQYLATRLSQILPHRCLMLDAQLLLHREAIEVVRKNCKKKMEFIAPDYFYDFLLRHPNVAIQNRHWFARCKPFPPTTDCAIDTKVWSLAMMVRGATAGDPAIDESEE